MNFPNSSDIEQNTMVGFGFHPTDHELVYEFLKEKLDGILLDCDEIPEVNIYNHEPSDLPALSKMKSEDGVFYFFCPHTKHLKSRRPKRTTEAGYWKPTGDPRTVKHMYTKKQVGTKRTLVFHLGRPKGIRTPWVMHEYVYTENCSKDANITNSNQGDFVLCKIMRKLDSKKAKSESSLNTVASLVTQNEDCRDLHSKSNGKSKASFNTLTFAMNENEVQLQTASESIDQSESSFNTLISIMNQPEVDHQATSPHKSESGLANPISIMNENIARSLDILSEKSESSFNINMFDFDCVNEILAESMATSAEIIANSSNNVFEACNLVASKNVDKNGPSSKCDFLNGNWCELSDIVATTAINENEANCLVASTNQDEVSTDFRHQNQNPLITNSIVSNEKTNESESSFNKCFSSTFANQEWIPNSTVYGGEASYAIPSDLRNHNPNKSCTSVSFHDQCNSSCLCILDFEDQSPWKSQASGGKENQSSVLEFGDCDGVPDWEYLLTNSFSEEVLREGNCGQLIPSSSNPKPQDIENKTETSNLGDSNWNENDLMEFDLSKIDELLAEMEALFELENKVKSTV